MSNQDNWIPNARPSQSPEALLRKMLTRDDAEKAVPLAKHKRFARRKIRRRKSTGHDRFTDYPESKNTTSHKLPPRERIDAIPEIDLVAARKKQGF